MNRVKLSLAAFGVVAIGFTSCKKDNVDVIAPYTIPDTYNFADAKYTEATQAVNMWQGFQSYLGKSTSRQLSQDSVNKLWSNTGSAFTAELISNLPNTPEQLNAATGINLAALASNAQAIKVLADSMVVISQYYKTQGGQGVAGTQVGSSGSKRLFNYSGLEFNQAVAKGLNGAFQMAKIVDHLDKSKSADNSSSTAQSSTAMQHQWDLAFGYTGIPVNYDTTAAISASSNINRPLGLGGYFRERGRFINSGRIVFEAFRKGRAAIGAKDYKVRDEAMATVKEFVEKTLAAAFYYYVTSPQTGTNTADRLHGLSEGYGFMVALKSRPASSKLTAANYQKLVDIMNTDFYTLLNETGDNTKLKQVQKVLVDTYGQLQ